MSRYDQRLDDDLPESVIRQTLRPVTAEEVDEALGAIRQVLTRHVEEGRPMSIRMAREAIPLKPQPIFPGAKGTVQLHRKGKLFVTIEVEDPGA